ncbi:MAG: hypothetical protein LLG14_01560 [Nocardiaceae bacterium]|nr:hypothetical protein [Nocardiaceae bacterium]
MRVRRLLIAAGVVALSICSASVASADGSSQYASGTTGVDISYPNCGLSASDIPAISYAIVGVTGGRVDLGNSCLQDELALLSAKTSNISFYANTGWYAETSNTAWLSGYPCPTTNTTGGPTTAAECAAYNYGYHAGISAFDRVGARGAGVMWWLDVETGNSWNADTLQNRMSLLGERDALIFKGASDVGAYSTTSQWNSITGTWNAGWYSWGATVVGGSKPATKTCQQAGFAGKRFLLIQYKPRKIDYDYAC